MRVALGVLLTFAIVAPAMAAPTLEIRARAELQVTAEPLGDGNTRVRVHMTDDVGAPMALDRVVVEARANGLSCGARASCITRRDGTCEIRLRGCDADEVQASFAGTDSIDGIEATTPVRATGGPIALELRLEGGTTVDLDRPEVRLRVERRGAPGPEAHLELTDELGRPIHVQELGPEPDTLLVLPTERLGPPGVGTIAAKLVEADQRETRARLMVIRQLRTQLRLRLASRSPRRLEATLTNSAGPIADALVTLRCDGDRSGESTTDARGRARFTLEPNDGSRECLAAFHPNAPGRTAAISPKVRLPQRPRAWMLGALPWASLATTFLVMGLLARRRRRDEEPEAKKSDVAPPTIEHSAPSQLVRSLHRVVLRAIAAEDDHPLPEAELVCDERAPIRPDAMGRFEFDLEGNAVTDVVVSAPGRAPENLRIRSPHRGEWSDVRVRLETTRMHARRAIEIVAKAASRDDDEAQALTLREAERRLGVAADPAFPDQAERQVYGESDPTLEDARALVDRGRKRITPEGGDTPSR